ncbi:alpha-ketoglutarate-dependent dioxygenase AlkB [bacterium]|nr:alpha-ketoglutarate-dependent dioxygenase AlkB [bacterium]
MITSLDLGAGDKVKKAKLPDAINDKIESIIDAGIKFIKNPHIIVFNKLCRQRRNVAFYSDKSFGYFYSCTVAKANPLTPELQELLAFVNASMGADFNSILINEYENGEDYISPHSDDERALSGGDAGVVSISWGDTRRMKFATKDKADNCQLGTKCFVQVEPGCLLQMVGPTFQKRFTHAIPVEKGAGRRISFTFRRHDPKLEEPMIAKLPAMEARISRLIDEKDATEAAAEAAAAAAQPAAKRAKIA